jgi:four helix bundle protein
MGNVAGSMGEPKTKIISFTQLDVWQAAHALRLRIYMLTQTFPSDERFALISQIRRASTSVGSNIAEGFSRRTSNDKAHFYAIAQGSLTEVQDQLILARDLHYINEVHFRELAEKSVLTHKLLTGFIKSVRGRRS